MSLNHIIILAFLVLLYFSVARAILSEEDRGINLDSVLIENGVRTPDSMMSNLGIKLP